MEKGMIKVASYNISRCQDFSITQADDAPSNIEKTATFIKEIDADIIGLNEVYGNSAREEWNAQMEKLKTLAGYPYGVEAVGFAFPFASIGNALLSKYPILNVQGIPVCAPTEEEKRENEREWYEDRVVLRAIIDKDGEEICVLATHFGLNLLEKERMVETLCRLIDEETRPIILMGDFNATPRTAVLQPLYDRLSSVAEETGNDEYTFSSFQPYITIDYVFCSKAFKPVAFKAIDKVVSDHRAVYAILRG